MPKYFFSCIRAILKFTCLSPLTSYKLIYAARKDDLGTFLCDSTQKHAKLQKTYFIFTYCNLLEPGVNGPF